MPLRTTGRGGRGQEDGVLVQTTAQDGRGGGTELEGQRRLDTCPPVQEDGHIDGHRRTESMHGQPGAQVPAVGRNIMWSNRLIHHQATLVANFFTFALNFVKTGATTVA